MNDKDEIMAFKDNGNGDDRAFVFNIVKGLTGKLIGDKGYILTICSYSCGVKNCTIIESVNDQLRIFSQIEHACHRSIWNFACNLILGLCTYALQPKTPFKCW